MSSVLHRRMSAAPEVAQSAEGIFISLAEGRKIIDACGGPLVACIGHGNRRVANAIARQAEKLSYVHTSFYSSEPAEKLAELLVGSRPGGLSRVFFVSSGSEAMESAMKLARQYFVEIGEPARRNFIARRQSYHGNTLGALGLSGHPSRREVFEPLLAKYCSHVSPCFPFHYKKEGETDAGYVARLAVELDAEFQRLGPETVIAFAAETMVGAATGCVTAVPGYFPAMKAVCDKYGALLILDEVLSGMGRTGTRHAWEQENVAPDIQILAKGLGGGYVPIGAVLISAEIENALSAGSGLVKTAHTYQAHPIACAGALEVQTIVAEEELVENVRRLGCHLRELLVEAVGSHPNVGDIRGRGFGWGIEFLRDRATKDPFAPSLLINELVLRKALDLGLAVYPGAGTRDGVYGDHVILAPPFNTGKSDLEHIVELFGAAVESALPH